MEDAATRQVAESEPADRSRLASPAISTSFWTAWGRELSDFLELGPAMGGRRRRVQSSSGCESSFLCGDTRG